MSNNLQGIKIDLSGKKVLLTGGTRGIGKTIATHLLQAGATVIATGSKVEEIDLLNKTTQTENLSYLTVDFTKEDSTRHFLEWIRLQERIDILVNNAGVNRISRNTETSNDDFDYLNTINLKVPYMVSREVSRLMLNNNYGRIVNISSIWSSITKPGRSLYTLTKTGLVGLTRALAVELAENNILVNAVAPGFTLTELTERTNTPEELKTIATQIPMKRMAQPAEIANLVLFLCSDLNTYLTGQNIIIDGGYTTI